MSRFIENIKIRDGIILNPDYHIRRFNITRQILFPQAPILDLEKWIRIPDSCKKGIFQCSVTYGEEIENIEFEHYLLTLIKSLKLVIDDDIEYSFKYKNRAAILDLWDQKGNCDDIIIVKHHKITDSSSCNLAFLSNGNWYTPRHPLLKGTKREKLLHESLIIESDIDVDDLPGFEKVTLMNAMIELGDCIVDINSVI